MSGSSRPPTGTSGNGWTGGFREDLYFRLNVISITVPALRDRPQDIPLLAQHFLEKYAEAAGKPVRGLAKDTLALLSAYAWPGNVRELEHVVERAVALSTSEILLPDSLSPELRRAQSPGPHLPTPRMTLEEVKRWYVSEILKEVGGNKVRAAEILGIDRRTLYRILAEDQATDGGS
jgi:DNA-binding NtrC family response regulator